MGYTLYISNKTTKENKMKNTTTKQKEAHNKLASATFEITKNNKGIEFFKTGVNSATLSALKAKGMISCSGIFLGGVVTKDIKIIIN